MYVRTMPLLLLLRCCFRSRVVVGSKERWLDGSYSPFPIQLFPPPSPPSLLIPLPGSWVVFGGVRGIMQSFFSSHVRTDYCTRMGCERKKMLLLSAGIAAVLWESMSVWPSGHMSPFPPTSFLFLLLLSYETRKASFFGEVAGFLIWQKREPNERKTRNTTFRENLTKWFGPKA